MSTIESLICGFVALLLLLGRGSCQCALVQVKIVQSKAGTFRQKPEWRVTINNKCHCSLEEMKLACKGFRTTKRINPFILSKTGDTCLVNNGMPVYPTSSFTFTYAWDRPFAFKLHSATPTCS